MVNRTKARQGVALTALATVLAVTAMWWALALWPLSGDAPEWLTRARAVCFGTLPGGLPDASGWIALILQPTLMIGTLVVVWGDAVRAGLRSLAGARLGRITLGIVTLAVLAGVSAIGMRIRSALASDDFALASLSDLPAAAYPRLDRPAPPTRLTNQHGDETRLEEFRGRVVFVTFAFAHCQTICPLVVNDALRAQRELAEQAPVVLVVTLDPWRDTPARLPHIGEKWSFGEDAFVLSGEVDAVNAVLDGWNIPRERDQKTGDISHPPIVYLVDADGAIGFAAAGNADVLVELTLRLERG